MVGVLTMAALRTTIPNNANATCILAGFNAAYDGGGGAFYWDNISHTGDDGGTIIVPTGSTTGRWIRIFDQSYVSVKWWGAYGDGDPTHDDTAAIVAAIAKAQLAGIFEIFIPPGNYLISSEITLAPIGVYGPALTIRGAGGLQYPATTLVASTTMRSIFNVTSKIHIRDLALNANSNADYGLLRNQDASSVYERLTITNALFDGIHAKRRNDADTAWNINDTCQFLRCWVLFSGQAFSSTGWTGSLSGVGTKQTTGMPGTVTTDPTSSIITGSGTSVLD